MVIMTLEEIAMSRGDTVLFRDVTTVVQDAEGLRLAIDTMQNLAEGLDFDAIVGAESRGFLFGMPLAYNLKKRGAHRVFAGATFAFFTKGLEAFDQACSEGALDHVFATNLTYTPPEVLARPWFSQADMCKYMAYIVATLNHDTSLSYLLNPWHRIEKLLKRYRDEHPYK